MSTPYQNGQRFEHRVRAALRDDGYEVFRAAGSKTKADLIAIKRGQILLVQCKRTNGQIPPVERAELVRIAELVGALPIVAHRSRIRGPLTYRRLTGTGPKDWQEWGPEVAG